MKALLLIVFSLCSSSALATDYSNVHCNNSKLRKVIMETYNKALKDAGEDITSVDVYDMKIESRDANKLICTGFMDFSTGDEMVPAIVTLRDNSFGETMIFVELQEEEEE
ncbi:TPA: hypothetical protein UOR20_003934 [Escherichia coli]|nr:hypothetical protein [Escherichia coli]ELM8776609.1 hypothetical protein [Escherichia coli]EMA4402821.1 hypothetical protein [Escherichia coli]HAH8500967.1 hypothetical protein [Escherichia coli]HEL5853156.1 hypothetical protein [Escherichia coli]